MHPSIERVHAYLAEAGHNGAITLLDDSARTAAQAASALGCAVAQIAKSLVFAAEGSGGASGVLVIASGVNRVSEERVAALVGAPIAKASADQVREWTGYAIGGVPPVAHRQPLVTLLDEDLWLYEGIWAAAGHPHAVFPLAPDDLLRWTGGTRASIKP